MTKLAETIGLTDVQSEIISTVRQFVEKEVIPNAPELERTDTYPQAIVDQMREMGLFGLMIPQEYGGLGESLLTYALCVEELARGWMSISGVLNTHFIVAYMLRQHGTDEQKQRFLPRMAVGEIRGSFSMSEPELGSDVAAIRTRATRGGDGDYTINGQKMWLTNGASSSLVAVLVRTDEGAEAPHRNLTAFLIEKPTGFGEVLRLDASTCRPGRSGWPSARSSSPHATPSSVIPSASRSPSTRPLHSKSRKWQPKSRPLT
jgi:alkylation response protein AidB-like acyl-CoA dehydrogenase